MIVFKTIRWRNFLSTGNQFIIVSFQKSPTNLIVGANGAGKSTILDALTFVLYNKPFRKIKKSQLINTVNEKECEVQIEFEIQGKIYTIVRGMKPTLFEIYVDYYPYLPVKYASVSLFLGLVNKLSVKLYSTTFPL